MPAGWATDSYFAVTECMLITVEEGKKMSTSKGGDCNREKSQFKDLAEKGAASVTFLMSDRS